MQRSSKGFGLIGVACAVVFLIITAVVSTSSHASSVIVLPVELKR